MAVNYFLGWSVKDLETELRSAQEDLASGKATIQAGAGDASSQSRVEVSITGRIQMILRALYALDPEKYPLESISAITQTRATFSYNRLPESGSFFTTTT